MTANCHRALEQWVLCKMNEMEVAEMIEEHIDFYNETKISATARCICRCSSCGTSCGDMTMCCQR